MAKKTIRIKKQKYTRRKNVLETGTAGLGKSSETLDQSTTKVAQEKTEENRASERTSIFINDCRVPVRNLTDLVLLTERGRLSTKIYELRRNLESLENLSFEMYREAEYRKL